jgi:hypothetical protein
LERGLGRPRRGLVPSHRARRCFARGHTPSGSHSLPSGSHSLGTSNARGPLRGPSGRRRAPKTRTRCGCPVKRGAFLVGLAGRSEVLHTSGPRCAGPAIARICGRNRPHMRLRVPYPPYVHATPWLPHAESARPGLNTRRGTLAHLTLAWDAVILSETHGRSPTSLAESTSLTTRGGHGPSLHLAVVLGGPVADLAGPAMLVGVFVTVLVVVARVVASSVVPAPAPAAGVPMTVGPDPGVPMARHPGVPVSVR